MHSAFDVSPIDFCRYSFGYKPVHVAMSKASQETLHHNSNALKQSMLWLSVLAWIVCFGIYTLLYWYVVCWALCRNVHFDLC